MALSVMVNYSKTGTCSLCEKDNSDIVQVMQGYTSPLPCSVCNCRLNICNECAEDPETMNKHLEKNHKETP